MEKVFVILVIVTLQTVVIIQSMEIMLSPSRGLLRRFEWAPFARPRELLNSVENKHREIDAYRPTEGGMILTQRCTCWQ